MLWREQRKRSSSQNSKVLYRHTWKGYIWELFRVSKQLSLQKKWLDISILFPDTIDLVKAEWYTEIISLSAIIDTTRKRVTKGIKYNVDYEMDVLKLEDEIETSGARW